MLGNCKMLLERDGGYIAINPKFDKLIYIAKNCSRKRWYIGQGSNVI